MKLISSLRLTLLTLITTAVFASAAYAVNDLSVTYRDGSEGNGRLISSLNIQNGDQAAALFLIGVFAFAADCDIHLVHMEITNRSNKTAVLTPDQFEVAAGGNRYELTQFMTVAGSPVKTGGLIRLQPNGSMKVYGTYAAPNWVAERVRSKDATLYIPAL